LAIVRDPSGLVALARARLNLFDALVDGLLSLPGDVTSLVPFLFDVLDGLLTLPRRVLSLVALLLDVVDVTLSLRASSRSRVRSSSCVSRSCSWT
jgi:hypothetical protein